MWLFCITWCEKRTAGQRGRAEQAIRPTKTTSGISTRARTVEDPKKILNMGMQVVCATQLHTQLGQPLNVPYLMLGVISAPVSACASWDTYTSPHPSVQFFWNSLGA